MGKILLQHSLPRKIILYEIIGIITVILLSLFDELLDIPHFLFGCNRTPINYGEIFFEIGFLSLWGIFIIFLSIYLLNKIRYLEGFLLICMYCRKIKIEKGWLSMENCIIDNPDTEFSFGLCPECIEEHYGKVLGPERLKKVLNSINNANINNTNNNVV